MYWRESNIDDDIVHLYKIFNQYTHTHEITNIWTIRFINVCILSRTLNLDGNLTIYKLIESNSEKDSNSSVFRLLYRGKFVFDFLTKTTFVFLFLNISSAILKTRKVHRFVVNYCRVNLEEEPTNIYIYFELKFYSFQMVELFVLLLCLNHRLSCVRLLKSFELLTCMCTRNGY